MVKRKGSEILPWGRVERHLRSFQEGWPAARHPEVSGSSAEDAEWWGRVVVLGAGAWWGLALSQALGCHKNQQLAPCLCPPERGRWGPPGCQCCIPPTIKEQSPTEAGGKKEKK